jgi:hypothetical protein
MNQSIIDKYITNINNGCTKSLYYLINYYKQYEDYPNMIKYYLKATEIDSIEAGVLIKSYINEDNLKYYLEEIKNNNKYAMNIVGLYYDLLNNNFNTEKYYMMAINNGCTLSMTNLAMYYKEQNDYKNMLKYYFMAIENNDIRAISELGYYYEEQGEYENMLKYYYFGVQQYDIDSISGLAYYYEKKKIMIIC